MLERIQILYLSSYNKYILSKTTLNRMSRLKLLLSASLCAALYFYSSNHTLSAQDLSENIWYFGNSPQGIIFNKSDNQPNIVNNQNPALGTGGSAVATEQLSMDLYFYTDGNNVFDASHQAMPGGTLNANTNGNQPVAISPVPGSQDRFIVLTNNAAFGTPGNISYSEVDMTLAGNSTDPGEFTLGELTGTNQATGINNVSEAMITISGGNPRRFWLIVAPYNSTEVQVYEIAGLNTYNLTNTVTLPSPMIAANFSYSEVAGKIAISPQNQNRNIEIVNFNRVTGDITYDGPVLNTANSDINGEAVYDTEWSATGQYLYISRFGGTGQIGDVYQHDFSNPTASLQSVLPGTVARSYGLQRGPDNRIYHLYQATAGGPFVVGRINAPDSVASLTDYETLPFGNINFSGRQFPQFLPQMDLPPLDIDFTYIDSCQNNITKFFPEVADDSEPLPTRYIWDFGDGSPRSNTISPSHEYQNPSTYFVTMIAIRSGEADTVQKPVTIIQNDNQVDLGQDTVICIDEVLELDAGPGGISYTWSTGETSQTIEVDTTGFYWVSVEFPNGCQVYDGIQVDEYGAEINTANFWYFGNQAGIDFNQQPAVAVTDGQMTAPEGVATISDQNGDLLFYTDGSTVWGRNHTIIGQDIGGSPSSTQSSLIVQHPGDETLFYIFTTEEIWGDNTYNMNYSVVDIKENNGNGAVIIKDKPLFAQSTERMTAVDGQGGTLMLAHEFGNNTFRLYPIDDTGIQNPQLSSIGSPHNVGPRENGEGYMKFSPDATKVAVALSGPGNAVELFDVDTAFQLSNFRRIDLPDPFPQYQAYGIEFSSGGSKLYVSLVGSSGSKIYEYFVDTTDFNYTLNNPQVLYDGSERFGAIQIGPDGQIYVARDGSNFLGTIAPREDTVAQSSFIEDGFDLAGRTSALGLPNFIQSNFTSVGGPSLATTAPGCVGTEVTFTATTTSIIDEIQLTVRRQSDSTIVFTSMEEESSFVFDSAGVYNLALQVFNRCGLDTTIVDVLTVEDSPEEPTIPDAASICDPTFTLDADSLNTPGNTFLWTTGETTRTIEVSQQGTYGVTITNAAGCTSEKDAFIGDGRPQFDLGLDQTVCQNEPIPDLNTGISAVADFTWTINGVDQMNENPSQSVDTSTPGDFEYVVEVQDPITTCVAFDTISYEINPEPEVDYQVTDATCGDQNGEIEIPANPNNFTFAWTDDAGTDLGNANPLQNIGSGTYDLQVQNPTTGCTNTYAVGVSDSDAPFSIDNLVGVPGCSGENALEVTLNGISAFPLTFTLTNSSTGVDFSGTGGAANNDPFTISNLTTGDYVLEITDQGCTVTDSSSVSDLPATQFSVTLVDNCSPAEITATSSNSNPSFNWTSPGGYSNTGATINDITVSDDYYLEVTSTDACPAYDTINVLVADAPTVVIEPVSDVCDGELQLTANTQNSGQNFSYVWSNNGTPIPNSSLETITLTGAGNYSIEVIVSDQQTGCTADAGPEDFEVFPEITISLVSSEACDDGEPIRLTASANISDLTYSWFDANGPLPDNPDTTVIQVSNAGFYRVQASINGCSEADSLTVNRLPVTESGLQDLYAYCAEAEPDDNFVLIETTNDFIQYSWLDEDGNVVVNPQLEVSGGDEGQYIALLTNAFGCVTVDTFSVDNDCAPIVFVPNAFTPNQDGNNDVFEAPVVEFVSDFQIFIYSRWGELIFQSDDPEFQWDGTFAGDGGELLPIGTYPYVIRFRSLTSPEVGVLEKRGGVTLIR